MSTSSGEGDDPEAGERNDFAGDDGQWVQLMGKEIQFQRLRILPKVPIAEIGVIVKCHIKGYFYSVENMKRLLDEPFEELENQYYQVGEGDAIPGLELGLRHSRKGEKMRSICTAKFAFGTNGRGVSKTANILGETTGTLVVEKTKSGMAVIPPNMDLEYEIEVLEHLNEKQLHPHIVNKYQKELEATVGNEEAKDKLVHRLYTIQSMTYRKEAGNRWFSFEDFDRSARAYSNATKLAEGYFNSGSSNTVLEDATTMEERIKAIEEKEQQKEQPVSEDDVEIVGLYVTCLNNLAACKLSKGEFTATKELCVKVLQFSPFNGKALLRAAKATLALDAFEECELCLKRLLSIEQLDDTLKNSGKAELAKLRKAQLDYKNKLKQMQQKMANKLFNSNNSAKEKKDTEIEEKTAVPEIASPKVHIEESDVSTAEVTEIEEAVEEATTTETAVEQKGEESTQVNSNAATATSTKVQSTSPTAKAGGNNMMMLVATSLVVVIFSLVIAYINR